MGRYYTCAVLLILLIQISQICLCANSNVPCIEQEMQALLDFKASIAHDSPNKLSTWKGTHCCQWEGIGCDNVTGHVVKLDLRNPDFYTDLVVSAPNVSSSLLRLEYLTYLDLTGNNFSLSPIPMFIGSMGCLEYLSLSYAAFSGRIPNNLGNLKNLHFLGLSNVYYDEFRSSLQMSDDTSWISKLHSLKHLDLSGIPLSHRDTLNLFQVLNLLPSLLRLSLSHCKLDNSLIPRHSFQNMTSLVYLDLSSNGLHGPFPEVFRNMTFIESLILFSNNFTYIPTWFSDFQKLTHLDLSYNGLHGQIPYAFMNLSTLVHLDLQRNYLDSGPSLLYSNLKNLVYLDLSFNNFNSIPPWFSDFQKLTHLDLSSNGLHGPFPEVFRNMTFIESLILSENNFTYIPSWFSDFQKLTLLDLSSNGLHGQIPYAFMNLSTLVHLDLQGNYLDSGPSLLYSNLKNLVYLDLSFNYFTLFPSWLAELKRLVFLYFRSNQLTLTECFLSSIITNMCHLNELDLSENKLQGKLMGHFELSGCITYDLVVLNLFENDISDRMPTWLGQLENLKYLDFSSNFFHGPIPLSIGKLSKLEELVLSNNSLEGVLPSNIGQLVNLTHLDLSSNKFDGSIPQSLGKLANLRYLDLSNNHFNGPIPKSFVKLLNLQTLDISSNKLDGIMFVEKGWPLNLIYLNLSHNQLSGSLPKNIGHIIPNLGGLFLRNNHLNGSIPISLCQTLLSYLDISKNNLSGEIPNCWEDNQGWIEINLSSNKLTREFPSSFGNLSTLCWLHLNNNSLKGELPKSFKNLKQLVILDLGENNFSRSIPSSWTTNTFPSLQVLRLRQNMLSGSIPSQLCQLKSLKILDIARNKLHGSIPRCIGNLNGMILESRFLRNLDAEPHTITEFDWYNQAVIEVVKGMEREYTKILKLVVLMDLSQNNLVGFIPNEITLLTGLHNLNLSKNQLKGEIPRLIGNMKSLESLDMSRNQLSGTIPNTMSALTSLSQLNLSHNNFSGPIPKENQFLTFDDPSIFAYNPYLCGPPLPNKCPDHISHGTCETKGDGDEDEVEKVWFYFVIALGFATGLWGVIGTLWFKKNWRHAYFRWVEDVADDIYVAVVIKVAKIKKKLMINHVHG